MLSGDVEDDAFVYYPEPNKKLRSNFQIDSILFPMSARANKTIAIFTAGSLKHSMPAGS